VVETLKKGKFIYWTCGEKSIIWIQRGEEGDLPMGGVGGVVDIRGLESSRGKQTKGGC